VARCNLKLLNSIKNPKERREFWKRVCEEVKGNDDKVLASLAALIREMQRARRERKRKRNAQVVKSDTSKDVVQSDKMQGSDEIRTV
jgi:hypothetical protein